MLPSLTVYVVLQCLPGQAKPAAAAKSRATQAAHCLQCVGVESSYSSVGLMQMFSSDWSLSVSPTASQFRGLTLMAINRLKVKALI